VGLVCDVLSGHCDGLCVGEFLPLAGAERMPELPLCGLVPTRPLSVSHRAICASVDALAHRRVSRTAGSFLFLPSTSRAAYLCCAAWLSRVSRRGAVPGGRSTVPLPAGVLSARARGD